MNRVARSVLLQYVRRESTHKRKLNHVAQPFSVPMRDGDSGGQTVEDAANALAAHEREPGIRDLTPKLKAVLDLLTPKQQAIVELLHDGVSKSEISRRHGISRDTVYAEISRIRNLFLDNGLKDYLD